MVSCSLNAVNPPRFVKIMFSFLVMTTSTPEKADGLKALELAIEKIKETIVSLGGVFNTQMAVSSSKMFESRWFSSNILHFIHSLKW